MTRIDIAKRIAAKRLEEAKLEPDTCFLDARIHHDGSVALVSGYTVSAADIDAQIELEREITVLRWIRGVAMTWTGVDAPKAREILDKLIRAHGVTP